MEMNRNNARKVEIKVMTIEGFVEELLQYQTRGESVVAYFDGHPLYSCDITLDGAYQEICGKTKKEFEDAQKQKKEWLNKIPDDFDSDVSAEESEKQGNEEYSAKDGELSLEIQILKASLEKGKLEGEIKDLENQIEELKKALSQKQEELDRLEEGR